MPLSFPLNPTLGMSYSDYVWNGVSWETSPGRCSWIQLTQAQYDALAVKDPGTLYVIVG